jgi:hypothetical protein
METKYTAALEKLKSTAGAASELARAGKYAESANLLLRMGVRGDYWRACREAAGLAYDDATNDAEVAAIIAAKKAKFKK